MIPGTVPDELVGFTGDFSSENERARLGRIVHGLLIGYL